MYNTDLPSRADLPTHQQLIKSTIIAFITAIILLITIVLPSEYAIDPTGIGRFLGLTDMGEIKQQLEEENKAHQTGVLSTEETPFKSFNPVAFLLGIKPAHAEKKEAGWTDTFSITLAPSKGTEVKLLMKENTIAEFEWVSENGVANYDLHGDGTGQSINYKKGRGVPGDKGQLKAKFDGNHGWFWRNRDRQPITINLRVKGDYIEMKHIK